jgi:hypothetical protein
MSTTDQKPTTISIRALARNLAATGIPFEKAQLLADRIRKAARVAADAECEVIATRVAAARGVTLTEARAEVGRVLGATPPPVGHWTAPGAARALARRIAATRGIHLSHAQILAEKLLATKAR